MDITGVVFICVIFTFSMTLVVFCCLKFCTSEEKYERNPGSGSPPILPATDNTSANRKKSINSSTNPPHTSESKRSDMNSNRHIKKQSSEFTANGDPSISHVGKKHIQKYTRSRFKRSPPLNSRLSLDDTRLMCPPKPGFVTEGSAAENNIETYIKSSFNTSSPPDRDLHGDNTRPISTENRNQHCFQSGSTLKTIPKPGYVLNESKAASVMAEKYCAHPKIASSLFSPPKSGFVTNITREGLLSSGNNFSTTSPPKIGLAVNRNQFTSDAMEKGGPYPKSDTSLILPPKAGFIVDGTQSVGIAERSYPNPEFTCNLPSTRSDYTTAAIQSGAYTSIILPPAVGFDYIANEINKGSSQMECPYPPPRRRRTPSPNPAKYNPSYSPRTSAFFSDSEGPFSGITLSSEYLSSDSKSRPPSYIEAMLEQKSPANKDSTQDTMHVPKPSS